MNAPLRVLSAILAALLLAGCFQSEIVISVKPDGSGTVTETMLMSKTMVDQMKQMVDGFGKGFGEAAKEAGSNAKGTAEVATSSKGFDLLDEKKLKEAAAKMGEGVTFVSAKKHSTDKGEGYIAKYAFTDINKLRIDENRSDALPQGGGLDAEPKKDTKAEPITFQFKKGKVAELIIKNPATGAEAEVDKTKTEEPAKEETPGGEEMAMMMMQQMFKDMKLTVAVEVAGKIVKTDAEHVAGSRVTLLEMDFNKLMANPAKFKELSKANPKTIEETKALVKGIDGVKAETKPSVSVQFQ